MNELIPVLVGVLFLPFVLLSCTSNSCTETGADADWQDSESCILPHYTGFEDLGVLPPSTY